MSTNFDSSLINLSSSQEISSKLESDSSQEILEFESSQESNFSQNKMLKTFKDLIHYNLEFLSGQRNEVVYHHGPVDSETEPYLRQLICLHEMDILTTCSQHQYSKD